MDQLELMQNFFFFTVSEFAAKRYLWLNVPVSCSFRSWLTHVPGTDLYVVLCSSLRVKNNRFLQTEMSGSFIDHEIFKSCAVSNQCVQDLIVRVLKYKQTLITYQEIKGNFAKITSLIHKSTLRTKMNHPQVRYLIVYLKFTRIMPFCFTHYHCISSYVHNQDT